MLFRGNPDPDGRLGSMKAQRLVLLVVLLTLGTDALAQPEPHVGLLRFNPNQRAWLDRQHLPWSLEDQQFLFDRFGTAPELLPYSNAEPAFLWGCGNDCMFQGTQKPEVPTFRVIRAKCQPKHSSAAT